MLPPKSTPCERMTHQRTTATVQLVHDSWYRSRLSGASPHFVPHEPLCSLSQLPQGAVCLLDFQAPLVDDSVRWKSKQSCREAHESDLPKVKSSSLWFCSKPAMASKLRTTPCISSTFGTLDQMCTTGPDTLSTAEFSICPSEPTKHPKQ